MTHETKIYTVRFSTRNGMVVRKMSVLATREPKAAIDKCYDGALRGFWVSAAKFVPSHEIHHVEVRV